MCKSSQQLTEYVLLIHSVIVIIRALWEHMVHHTFKKLIKLQHLRDAEEVNNHRRQSPLLVMVSYVEL